MKVIVTGGRPFGELTDSNGQRRPHWHDERMHAYGVLSGIHRVTPITTIVQGGATGGDALARAWALRANVPYETFEADPPCNYIPRWAQLRGRNRRMVDAGADLVVALPGGSGTAHCVDCAGRVGIPVRDERGFQPDDGVDVDVTVVLGG